MAKACTLKVSPANKEKVDGFSSNLYEQVQNFLSVFVPEKIHNLDKHLKSDLFNVKDLTTLHAELNIPIPDPPTPESEDSKMETDKEEKKPPKCGFLKENEKIQKILSIVLPEIRTLREGCALIITWIYHLIPKIEDGNDFGVSVQEKVLERVTAIKTNIEKTHTNINKYFTERGDAVAKASKETHVMDYRALVHDKDEGACQRLRPLRPRRSRHLSFPSCYRPIARATPAGIFAQEADQLISRQLITFSASLSGWSFPRGRWSSSHCLSLHKARSFTHSLSVVAITSW